MRIVSTAGSLVRHSFGALAEGLLIAALLAALLLALSPVSKPASQLAGTGLAQAAASKGGSWIALSQDGAARAVAPSLGGDVAFATGYPTNVKNPRIEVLCYQDGQLVYGEAGSVDHAFRLGGGGSIWLSTGGAAECTANLFYFGWKAGTQTYNRLATTSFSAGG
jgi:hypothetical protein